jgi:PAS domain S-box-containing protein
VLEAVASHADGGGAVVLLRDASAQRELEAALRRTEERLAAAQRVAHVGSWEWNLVTGAISWSEEMYRLTGVDPGAEPVGYAEYMELVNPADRDRLAEIVQRALETGEDYEVVYRMTPPGGTELIVEGRGAATLDDAGSVVWLAGTARDLTDEHRVREERRRLEEEFMRAQKLEALALLSGEIAHDFNNALTAIRGYAALVLDQLDPGSPAVRDLLELSRTAEHATGLPRQLLAFARRKQVHAHEVELGAAVRDLRPLLDHVLGVERTLVVPPGDEVWVRADSGQLEQALVNLTLNARDAMEEAGGELTIRAATIEVGVDEARVLSIDPGRYGSLIVRDTGSGMDAETVARATEPFFTTKQDRGGTGLGLSAVAGGAAQTGGAMRIASELGVGTTVELLLPAVAPPAPAGARRPDRVRRDATVLVVDDEPNVLAVIARVLGEEGYEVVATTSAADALEQLRDEKCRPALLVTDLRMPELGGVELAGAARRLVPDLAVLFLSGFPEDITPDDARHLLVKPFSPQQLVVAVGRRLGGANGDREPAAGPA